MNDDWSDYEFNDIKDYAAKHSKVLGLMVINDLSRDLAANLRSLCNNFKVYQGVLGS